MNCIELFAGAGGAALGLEAAGIHHKALCEWDPSACATMRAAGLGPVVEGDVRDLDAIEAVAGPGPIDLLWSSFPCQAFSTAGKRLGASDERNGWPWTVDAIDRFRPRWFLGENVRGLLCHSGEGHPDPMRCPACYLDAVILPQLRERFAHVGYWLLDAADYGIVAPCPLHDSACPTDAAVFAANASRCATELAYAAGAATTSSAAGQIRLAVNVVARSAKAIRKACAGHATAAARRASLRALARKGPPIPHGRVDALWTTVGMSECGWTDAMSESIASWLLASSADLFTNARWSTTSTATRRTTIRRILRSIEATAITGPTIGTAPRSAGCGLCHDGGVPQHRRRVILWAGPVPLRPPEPTHADPATLRQGSMFGPRLLPWVSMGEALGITSERIIGGGSNPRGPDEGDTRSYRDLTDEPSTTIAAVQIGNAGPFVVAAGETGEGRPRPMDQAAPTIGTGGTAYLLRPAPTVMAGEGGKGCGQISASATARAKAEVELLAATGRRRLTVQECARLQDFPADHPWQGTKTAQYRQVGNAVPPTLARVVAEVVLRADAELQGAR